MGLWFVDSFDHYDEAHLALKYKNPDDPNGFELLDGNLNTVLSRTGRASFRGTLRKWHGTSQGGVWMGIAFHSSTVESGIWTRQVSTGGGQLFYQLAYESGSLRAEGFSGIIAGPTPITIIDGWNYLEWYAELHTYSLPDPDYIHNVYLNDNEIFIGTPQIGAFGPHHYTTLFPTLGSIDDFYVVQRLGGIHIDRLGAIRVHKLMPIDHGNIAMWKRQPPLALSPSLLTALRNWEFVDDWFNDPGPIPNDDFNYLYHNLTFRRESYKLEQIDPLILDILGFQYNNYCFNPDIISPILKHQYYNPDLSVRPASTFSPPKETNYEYRTEFKEFPFGEVEPGFVNNGNYINNSRFGYTIETGADNPSRVSQFCIEIVVSPVIPPDIPVPAPVTISIANVQTFKFTKLWKFDLQDGTTHYFTNHNTTINHDGNTYSPVASLLLAATQRQTGITPTNTNAIGIIDVLSFSNFFSGLIRGTKITEFLLNWQYPWAGFITSNVFTLQEYSFDAAKWRSDFASAVKRITYPKGHVYGRTCRHVLGDNKCKVALDFLEQTQIQVLPPIIGKTQFRAFVSITPDEFDNDRSLSGYFNFGNLLFTSGPNNGISREIRSSIVNNPNDLAIQSFTLQVPTPFNLVAGSRFTIWPGCDKLWSTCKDKFENPTDGDIPCGNTKNFGGFPTIPGKDGIFSPTGEANKVFSDEQVLGWLLNLLGNIF